MLKRMLNCPERITYNRLSEVCARRSAQVYAKVRLADVLPVEGSGLSEALYMFSLQAHYDFVITDLAHEPLFAVEFDGPSHVDVAQGERDAKKDELSRRFELPLLRILADDLHRSEWRLDRLTEVVERWFDGLEPASGDRFAVRSGPALPSIDRSRVVAETPPCPRCGSGMLVKHGKYGPFLSCARFPECRGSCDLPGPLSPIPPEAVSERGPNALAIPRRWLIAGVILTGFSLMALVTIILLVVFIARSNTDRSDAITPARVVSVTDPATARQRNLLGLLIRRRGWDMAERDAEIERVLGYSRKYSELSKHEASRLITAWYDRGK